MWWLGADCLCVRFAAFVHQTAIIATGFRYLKEGETVTYEAVKTERGVQAAKVAGPDGAPLERAERQQ